jgi:predicted phosphodiesterase
MRRSRILAALLTCAALAALAACGSGNGTTVAPDTIDTPTTDDGVTLDVPADPDVPPVDVVQDTPPVDVVDPDLSVGDDIQDVPSDVLPDVVVPACVGAPGQIAWPTGVSTTFLRGPFLQDVRDSHAVVVFRPAVPLTEQGCVEWSVAGVASLVPFSACVAPDAYGQYAVRLDDLPADAEVTYQVSAGATLTAGPFTFRSAPPLDRPQRIVVMSDLHANKDRTAAVLSKIVTSALSDGVDFALTCGDHVDQPEEAQFDDLFDGLRPLLHRVPLFATIGNHEGRNANYFEAFVLPEADPPDPEAPEMYYSFRRGNVWVGVLELIDWQLAWTLGGVAFGQVEWLAKELDSEAARSARWRILSIHQPPWGRNWAPCSVDNPNFGEVSLRDMLVPMARDKGVSAILSGHFHDYEHGQMDGVELFVLGGAGGGVENVECTAPEGLPTPWKSVEVNHRLTVETGCDALTIVATDIEGNEIDRVSVPHAAE